MRLEENRGEKRVGGDETRRDERTRKVRRWEENEWKEKGGRKRTRYERGEGKIRNEEKLKEKKEERRGKQEMRVKMTGRFEIRWEVEEKRRDIRKIWKVRRQDMRRCDEREQEEKRWGKRATDEIGWNEMKRWMWEEKMRRKVGHETGWERERKKQDKRRWDNLVPISYLRAAQPSQATAYLGRWLQAPIDLLLTSLLSSLSEASAAS